MTFTLLATIDIALMGFISAMATAIAWFRASTSPNPDKIFIVGRFTFPLLAILCFVGVWKAQSAPLGDESAVALAILALLCAALVPASFIMLYKTVLDFAHLRRR